MAQISQSEREFICQGILENIRSDGRTRSEWRSVKVVRDCLPLASGSARVSVYCGTEVLVGVRLDLGVPRVESPNQGAVSCAVDCSSTTGLDSILGRKLLDLNADFSRFILQLLQSCLPLESLCIAKGTHCWVLHVDVLVLGFGGNIFDVLNVAVLAALSSTKLPRVTISESLSSEFEQDAASVEVDSTSLTPLDVSKFPLTLTVCFPFDGAPEFYYDASVSEELASSTRIYITLLKSGKVCALRMGGGGTVEPLQLLQCIQQAKRQIPMLFSLVQSPSVPPNEPLF